MALSKRIIFVAIAFLAITNISFSQQMTGGWTNYHISSNFKQDTSSPLYKAYNALSSKLQQSAISGITFTSAQSQVVNGINFQISFTYVQDSLSKSGKCVVYIPFSGECEVTSLELQTHNLQSPTAGGWENYKFDSNFLSNPQSSLAMAFNGLSQNLKKDNLELVKFNQVKSQIVNGINFMVLFTYKREGKEMTGICKIYVNARENKLSVSDVQFNDEGMRLQQSNEVEGVAGGYTEIVFNPSSLEQSNSFISMSYKKMENKLQESKMTLMKVIKLEQQIVGGVNMRFTFLYRDQMAVKVGSCVVYGQPWMNSYEVVSMKLNGDVQMA